jgi:anaerobic selenocysteine-containing dehydrogenase
VDYTGLSYEKLRGPTGIPWPVTEGAPEGTDRLYTDAVFPTHTDVCETYGHDLLTGGAVTQSEHRAQEPGGRAKLRGADYAPAHEEPSEEYPLLYTTGRTVYQFHTRTKTGRARSLQDAAPDAWVEISDVDAERYGIAEGDVVRVESPRGAIQVRARVGPVRPGAVFAPFHYGSWDPDGVAPDDADPGGTEPHGAGRQANELTMTVWDPVSKQPCFKTAACRIRKVADATGASPAPTTAASAPSADPSPAAASGLASGRGRRRIPPTAGGLPTSSTVVATPHYPNDPALGTSHPAPTTEES